MQITRFFVALKKKTYAFRWTNQKSKSWGIGQKKNSAALLPKALTDLLRKQNLVSILNEQFKQLECIILGKNSVHQLPTGSGKTWAPVSAPEILDILRDNYGHDEIPSETRVLYIVPLLNIITTLELELAKLGIKCDILDSEHEGQIKRVRPLIGV